MFRILDTLEIALGQSETLLHRRHVRIVVLEYIFILFEVSASYYEKATAITHSYSCG